MRRREIAPRQKPMPRYFYPGVGADSAFIADAFVAEDEEKAWARLYLPFTLIDFPFSLVFDTVLLPYDLYQLTVGGRDRCGIDRSTMNRQQSPAGDRLKAPPEE